MTILDEVRRWARGLPDWQREAAARLDEKVFLEEADDQDLYAILKAARGIEDPQAREPRPLAAELANIRVNHGEPVTLLAVTEVRHVNALATKGALTFSPTGLTVIYGANGSGKSGYARVLKQVCFARDKREKVLPNTNLPADQVGIPSADLLGSIGGVSTPVTWVNNEPSATILDRVAVFDHTCARAFLDNEGSFAYAPAGLDILADLGAACGRMRARLQKDIDDAAPNVLPLKDLASRTSTVAGKVAAAVPTGVSEAQVIAAAGLSKEQAVRLETVIRAIAAPEPAAQAAAFRHQALRIGAISAAITAALERVSGERVNHLKGLIAASNQAKAAAELAAKAFHEAPGRLPQTGSEPWRAMFEAARTFAVTSEPVKAFPHLHVGDACPLCQQALDEPAVTRLVEFETFVTGEIQRAADAARETATVAFKQVREANVDLGLSPAALAELKGFSEELVGQCETFQQSLKDRLAAILKAAGKGTWDAIPEVMSDPGDNLNRIAGDLNSRAAAMEAAADETLKKKLIAERDELEARRLLGDLKAVAITAIGQHAYREKLRSCLPDVATTNITRKSTELTNDMATQLLMDALNEELSQLNIANLRVAMKAEGERGRASFKLVLERPGKMSASDVLSEGEQRAVAIASFLTERRLSGDGSGVIFDDPVCSMDHRHRQRVARRLAKEAARRQVIVFTHDMFFLFALMDEAENLEVEVAPRTVSQTQDGFGVTTNELPFDGSTTKARVGWLKNEQVACDKLNRLGERAAYDKRVRDLYTKLREAWEGCVEEMLLNGTVERFRKSVETNRLKAVEITNPDVEKVVENMTRCSNYAHNVARRADVEIPTPEEIAADIKVLDDWRSELEARRKKTKRG
ncbi:AAA family ATPase [Luteibacter jiangsuensis]|uniref:AAA family ATPase n=1 Tax=Luteibacter jiangsuensis TaxID=637577 RepID=A0ABX0QEQ7_9GAMM|nr:AAA family ATPase [Luteibacter jiangsuensis]NID07033.1 AAA family ATPase [Luteibacter jiangsuensis]